MAEVCSAPVSHDAARDSGGLVPTMLRYGSVWASAQHVKNDPQPSVACAQWWRWFACGFSTTSPIFPSTNPDTAKVGATSKRGLEEDSDEDGEKHKRMAIGHTNMEGMEADDLLEAEMELDHDLDDGFAIEDLMLSAGTERAASMMETLAKTGAGGSAKKEDVPVATTCLYVVATRKDALGQDLLTETLEKHGRGESVFFDYLSRMVREVKSVAKLLTTNRGAEYLRNVKEEIGVRFLTEAEFKADPETAGYAVGVHILFLRSIPDGLDMKASKDRELLAEDIMKFLVDDGGLYRRGEQLKDMNLLTSEKLGELEKDKLKGTVLNVQTSCTAGRVRVKSTMNLTSIVYRLESEGVAIDVPFIPPNIRLYHAYKVEEVGMPCNTCSLPRADCVCNIGAGDGGRGRVGWQASVQQGPRHGTGRDHHEEWNRERVPCSCHQGPEGYARLHAVLPLPRACAPPRRYTICPNWMKMLKKRQHERQAARSRTGCAAQRTRKTSTSRERHQRRAHGTASNS